MVNIINIYIFILLWWEVKEMKRIISACIEQTNKFESEKDYETYIRGLNRKRVKYKIVDKKIQPDNSLIVKVIRDYSNYSIGDYVS